MTFKIPLFFIKQKKLVNSNFNVSTFTMHVRPWNEHSLTLFRIMSDFAEFAKKTEKKVYHHSTYE